MNGCPSTEMKHHTSRGQRTGRGGNETHHTAEIRETPSSSLTSLSTSSCTRKSPGGVRPEAFAEPRPQERVQRHTVEELADFAPMLQILDVPVPQMVDQLVDVLRLFDAAIPGQLVAVPKISCPSRPLRAALAATQMAEQVGGSANGRVGCIFQFLVVVVPLAVEVFKVFTQNRDHFSLLSSRSLTFQFPMEV